MDAKQKYTEEEFEIDEYFLEQMRNYRNGAAVKVASVIDHMYGERLKNVYDEKKEKAKSREIKTNHFDGIKDFTRKIIPLW